MLGNEGGPNTCKFNCSHSIMALHTLGKGETQVQFLLGAPLFFAALADVVIAPD